MKFIITLAKWLTALLPLAATLYLLQPAHGWAVATLAAGGVYFIFGIASLIAAAVKTRLAARKNM